MTENIVSWSANDQNQFFALVGRIPSFFRQDVIPEIMEKPYVDVLWKLDTLKFHHSCVKKAFPTALDDEQSEAEEATDADVMKEELESIKSAAELEKMVEEFETKFRNSGTVPNMIHDAKMSIFYTQTAETVLKLHFGKRPSICSETWVLIHEYLCQFLRKIIFHAILTAEGDGEHTLNKAIANSIKKNLPRHKSRWFLLRLLKRKYMSMKDSESSQEEEDDDDDDDFADPSSFELSDEIQRSCLITPRKIQKIILHSDSE